MKKSISAALRSLGILLIGLMVSACTLGGGPEALPTPQFDGPPVVTIASPLPNSTYLIGTSVNLLARIENAGPEMQRVEVTVNNVTIGNQNLEGQTSAAAFSISQSWPANEAGTFTFAVVAFRPDGSSSTPATVTITVRENVSNASATPTLDTAVVSTPEPGGQTQGGSTLPTPVVPAATIVTPVPTTPAPTVAPTNPPPPTAVPATNTPDRPRVRVIQGANIRSGPGIVFNPPIGSLAAGDESDLLGRNPAGDWYKIRYYNGEGWILASLVETIGNTASVPVDAGPPTPVPTPIPPTPVPATPVPQTAIDLVFEGQPVIVPGMQAPTTFVCGRASSIRVTVRNAGSEASPGGRILVQDLHNGAEQGRTEGVFPGLAPGQTHTAEMFLTISTFVSEAHVTRITIDPDNQIPETNEGNNVWENTYVLDPSCP